MSKLKKAFEDPAVDPEQEVHGLQFIKGMDILPRTRLAGASKYDIASMEVGDAWVSDTSKDVRNVAVAARAYAKRNGGNLQYATRKTQDGRYALQRVA